MKKEELQERAKEIAKDSPSIQAFFDYNWDKFLFGFNDGDIKYVPIKDIKIKWADDYENAKYRFSPSTLNTLNHPFNNKSLEELPPIDLKLTEEGFILDDGHHRFYYAQLLGKKKIRAKIEIDINIFHYLDIDDPQKFYFKYH